MLDYTVIGYVCDGAVYCPYHTDLTPNPNAQAGDDEPYPIFAGDEEADTHTCSICHERLID